METKYYICKRDNALRGFIAKTDYDGNNIILTYYDEHNKCSGTIKFDKRIHLDEYLNENGFYEVEKI